MTAKKKSKPNPYAGAIAVLEDILQDWDDPDDEDTPKSCRDAIKLLKERGEQK